MGSRSIPSAVDCRVNFSSFFFCGGQTCGWTMKKGGRLNYIWTFQWFGGVGGGVGVWNLCSLNFFKPDWNTYIPVSLNHGFLFFFGGEANKFQPKMVIGCHWLIFRFSRARICHRCVVVSGRNLRSNPYRTWKQHGKWARHQHGDRETPASLTPCQLKWKRTIRTEQEENTCE